MLEYKKLPGSLVKGWKDDWAEIALGIETSSTKDILFLVLSVEESHPRLPTKYVLLSVMTLKTKVIFSSGYDSIFEYDFLC